MTDFKTVFSSLEIRDKQRIYFFGIWMIILVLITVKWSIDAGKLVWSPFMAGLLLVVLTGLLSARAGLLFLKLWMTLGHFISKFFISILLIMLYFLVLSPVVLFTQLFSGKKRRNNASNWTHVDLRPFDFSEKG
ncbi:MAG: hypothetical protein KDC49_07175 [Saprospiraceae bacterium]|nr:hypothetical protein [Saprospiraceae bacterium]